MRLLSLSLRVVLTLIYLGMWRSMKTKRTGTGTGCPSSVDAHTLRNAAFVVNYSVRSCKTDAEQLWRLDSANNRCSNRLISHAHLGNSLHSQSSVLKNNTYREKLLQRILEPGSCALHSASAKDCGGMMGHIEEKLIHIASTKGSPNQLAALRTLKLLIESDSTAIEHLLRFNILEVFLKVLQQPYQKNLWELMNSYIRSGSSKENVRLKMIQDTVLSALIALSRYNSKVRQRMESNEGFKTLLMRIYLCEMKRGKGMTGSVQKASQISPTSQTTQKFSASAGSNESDASSVSLMDKDDKCTKEVESITNCGIGLSKAIGNEIGEHLSDTQTLVRELLQTIGYGINEDSLMERYERALECSGDNETVLNNSEGLVTPSKEAETSTGATKLENLSQEYKDNYAAPFGSSIVWVPYMIHRSAGSLVESIRRHLNINLGEDLARIGNIDSIDDATIDSTEGSSGDVLFGMVALTSHKTLAVDDLTSEVSGTRELPTAESPYTEDYRYRVISNIKISTSDHLNGITMADNLLKKLHTVDSLKVLNDIVSELWALIGSKDKGAIEKVQKELDLLRVADIINLTLRHKAEDDKEAVIGSNAQRSVLLRIYSALKDRIQSYVSTIMPQLSEAGVTKDVLKVVEEDGNLDKSTSVDTDLSFDSVDPANIAENDSMLARKLQTSIFGLLINLIYVNGNDILYSMRECTPLIGALKSARSAFPSLLRMVDVMETCPQEYTPLLDRSRYEGIKETKVMHTDDTIKNIENSVDVLLRQRDHCNNLSSRFDVWQAESWMRHKCISKSSLGSFFNCHKLLNILGHHDQERFKTRGLRILSIDGGGSKGVVALEILKNLESSLGKPLHEAFDIICGTSCGGLLGALLALEKARVADIQDIFEKMISQVFTRDSYRVTGTRLLMRQAYYDENVLYKCLSSCFGNMELIDYSVDPKCPKFFCLSVQMNSSVMKPIVWRSYNYPPHVSKAKDLDNNPPRDGSFAIRAADALRATTAAPMYFPLMERNGSLFGDGALHANNPSLIAVLEGKMVYPDVPIECLVSVGTGVPSDISDKRKATDAPAETTKKEHAADVCGVPRKQPITKETDEVLAFEVTDDDKKGETFDINDVILRSLNSMPKSTDPKTLGLDQLINHVISSATSTEGVHMALQTLMDANKYFRFNPRIPIVRLDDTSREVLCDLKKRTKQYLEDDKQLKRMEALAVLFKQND